MFFVIKLKWLHLSFGIVRKCCWIFNLETVPVGSRLCGSWKAQLSLLKSLFLLPVTMVLQSKKESAASWTWTRSAILNPFVRRSGNLRGIRNTSQCGAETWRTGGCFVRRVRYSQYTPWCCDQMTHRHNKSLNFCVLSFFLWNSTNRKQIDFYKIETFFLLCCYNHCKMACGNAPSRFHNSPDGFCYKTETGKQLFKQQWNIYPFHQ